jgi:alkylation response protein AidB-like acyl-CoA dehydrogenase
MNLDLTDAQADLDATLVDILQRESSDEARLASLESGGFLDVVREAGPIEGALVVERAAEALMASLAGRVLVGPLAGVTDLPTMVGLTDAKRGRVVRHATRCESFFVVDGPDVLLATRDDVEVEPVASFFGSDFGRVTVRRGTTLDAAAAARVRQGWEAALAVEAGALMVAAIEMTAEYVTRRVQFGQPIGSIPTVQHQLARAYAMAVATRWLGRRGVWFVDDSFLTASAATYACHAAWVTYTNTHQVTGAIGITSEYGLVDRTNRILAIRQEFGGQRAHARRAARARRDVPKPWPSPVPPPGES